VTLRHDVQGVHAYAHLQRSQPEGIPAAQAVCKLRSGCVEQWREQLQIRPEDGDVHGRLQHEGGRK